MNTAAVKAESPIKVTSSTKSSSVLTAGITRKQNCVGARQGFIRVHIPTPSSL